MRRLLVSCVFVAIASWSQQAFGQTSERTFQAGAHFTAINSSEFDGSDFGVGVRVSWHPASLLGAEAEFTFYPGDLGDQPALDGNRVEGLFGVTVGPRLGRIRPFAKARPGFVQFSEADAPFLCILIFPPPLACRMAGGETVFALDLGGGVEVLTSSRTFIRFDLSDRLVKYPGPVIDSDRMVREDSFFGHDVRFQAGGGFRF
jgi:hypothetical protein